MAAVKRFGWLSLLAVFLLVFTPGNTQRQVKNKGLRRILSSKIISEVLQEIFRSFNTSNILDSAGANVSESCNKSIYDISLHKDTMIQCKFAYEHLH